MVPFVAFVVVPVVASGVVEATVVPTVVLVVEVELEGLVETVEVESVEGVEGEEVVELEVSVAGVAGVSGVEGVADDSAGELDASCADTSCGTAIKSVPGRTTETITHETKIVEKILCLPVSFLEIKSESRIIFFL